MGKECLSHYIPYLEVLVIFKSDEFLHVDDTYDVLPLLVIYGKPGVHALLEYLKDLVIGIIYINAYHSDLGDHDILGNMVGKIKKIVDHLTLFSFDLTILMADINISLDGILCYCIALSVGIDTHDEENSLCHTVYDNDKRCKYDHKDINDTRICKSHLVRRYGSPCLGNYLADYKYDKGKNTRHDPYRYAKIPRRKHCGDCRRSQIYYIIAYQHRAEQFGTFFEYAKDSGGFFIAVVSKASDTCFIARNESCLRRREKP